jgi:hypothetical protein
MRVLKSLSRPLHVDLPDAAWWASEAIVAPLRWRSMHNPANELLRIPLPRTSVNKEKLGDFSPYRREFGALLVAE